MRSQATALSSPQHELIIFADSQSLPEDYSSLHQNGGRGIRYSAGSVASWNQTCCRLVPHNVPTSRIDGSGAWGEFGLAGLAKRDMRRVVEMTP
jgi:hypothetical protein